MNSKARTGASLVALSGFLAASFVTLFVVIATSNRAYADTVSGAVAAQAATQTPAPTDHDQHHADATAVSVTLTPTVAGAMTQTVPSGSGMMGSRSSVSGTMPSGMMPSDMRTMMRSMHDQMSQMMTTMDIMMSSMSGTLSSSGAVTDMMPSEVMSGDMLTMMRSMHDQMSQMANMMHMMMSGSVGSAGAMTGTMPSSMMSGAMLTMMQNMRNMHAMMSMMSGAPMPEGPTNLGRLAPSLAGIAPLTVTQVRTAVSDYLSGLGNSDLAVSRVLVFDNLAYARVSEKSTGIGAFEVLVHPVTQAVSPEPGPNAMWNRKYVRMQDMMGGAGDALAQAGMPVSATDARTIAQRYLDTYLPGAKAADTAFPFYGYYSVEILRDGKTVGMLSVNGYSRQVILHTWHGNLIEATDIE